MEKPEKIIPIPQKGNIHQSQQQNKISIDDLLKIIGRITVEKEILERQVASMAELLNRQPAKEESGEAPG